MNFSSFVTERIVILLTFPEVFVDTWLEEDIILEGNDKLLERLPF